MTTKFFYLKTADEHRLTQIGSSSLIFTVPFHNTYYTVPGFSLYLYFLNMGNETLNPPWAIYYEASITGRNSYGDVVPSSVLEVSGRFPTEDPIPLWAIARLSLMTVVNVHPDVLSYTGKVTRFGDSIDDRWGYDIRVVGAAVQGLNVDE